ncbi:MAG: Ig-like domain-containing protein, partial [Planctomycetota bacterium]
MPPTPSRAADKTVTTNEDTSYTFSAADFGFSDVDAGDSLTKIKITVLESNGTLKLSGADVTLDQEILVADIGNLVFTPAQDANGTGYDSFQFKVHDGTGYSAGLGTTLVNATFDTDEDGFTFESDAFGTSLPEGASGTWGATYGESATGGLRVHLEDNSTTTAPISGAYTKDINLASDGWVKIDFDWRFLFDTEFDSDEWGEAIFEVDGTRYGSDTNNSLAHFVGNGSSGPHDDTGWMTASETIYLTAGNHTLKFGEYINKATSSLEHSWAYFDNIVVEEQLDYTITVDVTAVQDAPTAADNTVTTNEDTGYTFSAADFGFSDVDAGDSLTKIQITSLESAGTLKLSGADVTLNQEILVADIGNLVFTPAQDANGASYDSFDFKVHDGTEYSAAANTITVDVTAVQDAPTAADKTVTTNEDTGYTFSAADFGFSDVDAGDTLTKIQISNLASNGTLKLSGVDVTLSQEILVADIPNLVFTPAQDANGTGYDSFEFKVHDGTEYSVSQVASVLVNANFNAGTGTFTYSDDVFGTSNPTAAIGTWQWDGGTGGTGAARVNLVDNGSDSPASGAFQKDINLAAGAWVRITFDYNLTLGLGVDSDEYGEVLFAVDGTRYGSDTNDSLLHQDGGSGSQWSSGYATGTETIYLTAGTHTLSFGAYSNKNTDAQEWVRADFDNVLVEQLADYVMTVDVTAVQDAPTAADKTVTTNEDTGYTFSAADFGFSDVDAGDSLTKIQITSLESAGTLKLSGADVTLNQEILVADIGNLVFTPAQDANGASYDSFDFKVHDGTEYSVAANTITVDVTAVQDAPT